MPKVSSRHTSKQIFEASIQRIFQNATIKRGLDTVSESEHENIDIDFSIECYEAEPVRVRYSSYETLKTMLILQEQELYDISCTVEFLEFCQSKQGKSIRSMDKKIKRINYQINGNTESV
ncbi:Hypothetical_protein [Hexamita inflata]|uniref:Hypothetical_protein n=1 Tax=Hexamita inflata TaxID=28002 RepID=A0AA86URQ9_9EUKA|nr:Hypothetical protein HINF_LOCUS49922 [Hexamita inflata]